MHAFDRSPMHQYSSLVLDLAVTFADRHLLRPNLLAVETHRSHPVVADVVVPSYLRDSDRTDSRLPQRRATGMVRDLHHLEVLVVLVELINRKAAVLLEMLMLAYSKTLSCCFAGLEDQCYSRLLVMMRSLVALAERQRGREIRYHYQCQPLVSEERREVKRQRFAIRRDRRAGRGQQEGLFPCLYLAHLNACLRISLDS